MAKKTPVKKSRRRLKRSVRRSLAAVLMITAIGVAAIPVPENYAEEEDDPTVTTDAYTEVYTKPDTGWSSVFYSNPRCCTCSDCRTSCPTSCDARI